MFIGEYQNSIDLKGRVVMPSRFRDGLGSRFILTKGLDACLFVFSMNEWKNFEDKLTTLPMSSKDARAFVRYFFSSAVECETDRQGRLHIPQLLREHAKIDKELVTIGVNTRIEIWAREKWDAYQNSDDLDEQSIAERMASLGI